MHLQTAVHGLHVALGDGTCMSFLQNQHHSVDPSCGSHDHVGLI